MAISLSAETEKLLEEKLKSSEFRSADDMIRAALTALDELGDLESTPDEETLDAIDRAEGEIQRGEVVDWADVKARFRAGHLGTS